MQMAVTNVTSENDKENKSRIQNTTFDPDLFPIGIDTFDSCCMSNDINHFETFQLSTPNRRGKVKVANGGNMVVKGKGTIMWKLEDDEGVVHNINIKNVLHAPTLEHCLLSPEHVAQ